LIRDGFSNNTGFLNGTVVVVVALEEKDIENNKVVDGARIFTIERQGELVRMESIIVHVHVHVHVHVVLYQHEHGI
jgi:hypothetical protein